MGFVQLKDISLAFGERDIFKHVNLTLDSRSRKALAGGNGSGKTTLMKIIAGLEQPDSGELTASRDLRIGYLPQSGLVFRDQTLAHEAEKAYDYLQPMLEEKRHLEEELSRHREESRETRRLVETIHLLEEGILKSGYHSRQQEIHAVLTGLGFEADDFARDTGEFSGGWQMRIALARILLSKPDLLLLDEPTNYLDLEARNWLEGFLADFPGGLLMVSHDRYFLDVTVNEIAELFNGSLKLYRGNYSDYLKKRETETALLVKQYQQQQEEIAKLEDFISRFRYNASKAKQVQSRVKALEKIDRIEIPENMKKIHFSFPAPPHSGRDVLRCEGLEKAYGSLSVLRGLDLELQRGEKLVVAGVNGAGKSTLMRILAGVDSPTAGSIRYGSGVKIGYFSQETELTLNRENTVWQELEQESPTDLIPQLRNLLGAFLFRGDDIHKPVGVLSGGEMNRIALLKLLLHPSNLLIMDEPTNHLDLQSKDILLTALKEYSGTLIFVSHDRYFIEHLADRVLELSRQGAVSYPGNYRDYLLKKEAAAAETGDGQGGQPSAPEQASPALNSHREDKQLRNRIRKLEKEEGDLLSSMEDLEQEREDLQKRLTDPAVYSQREKAEACQNRLVETAQREAELMEQWEEIHRELESLCSR